MACPYFLPEAATDELLAARAPLGRIFAGVCQAGVGTISLEHCNFGYGRGICANFPEDAAVDAVRFTHYDGRLIYVLERDCSPVEHGPAASLDPQSVLGRQASAFLSACPS
jgi:hypothetical protein